MAILLPILPHGSETTISLKSSAVEQTPFLGGQVQRVARMGDKWSYSVTCRPMAAIQAQPFVTALLQSLNDKALCQVRLPGINQSAYSNGTAVAAGSGGRTLVHSGGGTTKFVGQFVSIVQNGVRYLHQITAVAGSTLTVMPALKIKIVGGEVCEFGAPKIEGWLDGNEQSWSTGILGNLSISFRINEAQ